MQVYFERKRSSTAKAVARTLDCPFRAEATIADYALMKDCYLDGAGTLQVMSNVVEAVRTEDLELTVFDYEFRVSYGSKSSAKYQTISRIQSPLLKLPSFILSPEDLMAKLGKWGGLQDIQVPDARAFNKKYIVRGDNEAEVLAILTPDVRQLLEQLEYVTIQSASNILFVIRAPWVLQTVSSAMVDEDKRILAVFLNAQQSVKL